MNQALAAQQLLLRAAWFRPKWLTQQFGERRWQFMCRDRAKVLTVIGRQSAMRRPAQRVCLLEDGVEYRCEIARRAVDDLQDFGGGGLLLQGLARFSQEPCVLHRNNRLVREVLQQRDLFVGKRPNLLAERSDDAKQRVVFAQRNRKQSARTTEFDQSVVLLRSAATVVRRGIEDVN